MSEQNQHNHNTHHETPESHEPSHESAHKRHEVEVNEADKQHGSHEHLEVARNKVEQHAQSTHEQTAHHKQETHTNHPLIVHKELKDMAFSRSMTRVRKQLSTPSKTFSKVIHQPAIDTASEFVGKTVARPSSMLAGAFFAFVGTSLLLWITRHYGYEYNYLVVIILFVIGGIIGIASESLWRMTHKNR